MQLWYGRKKQQQQRAFQINNIQRQWGDRHHSNKQKFNENTRKKTTIVELFSVFFYNVNDENVLITSETSLSTLTRSFHPSVRTHIIPWIERTKQMPIRWYMQGKWMENNGKTTWKHWHFAEIERDRVQQRVNKRRGCLCFAIAFYYL